MTHLTEEMILALRDHEPIADEAVAHVGECAECARALEDARRRAEAVERALAALTVPLPVENSEEGESAPAVAESGAVVSDQSGPVASEESSGTESKVIPIGRRQGDAGDGSPGAGGRGDVAVVSSDGPGRRDSRRGRSIGGGRRDAVRGTGARGASWTMRWLSRAAVLVLLGAGALSALPGPFNGWVPRVFSGAEVPATSSEPTAQAVEQVGGRMDVATGPVVVRLQGVPPGTLIDVRGVASGAVGVLAGTGSEFSYGSGEVRASVVGGPVTVELPEGVLPATLVVNGGTYLVVRASGMEVAGPLATSDEASLMTFRVPN